MCSKGTDVRSMFYEIYQWRVSFKGGFMKNNQNMFKFSE